MPQQNPEHANASHIVSRRSFLFGSATLGAGLLGDGVFRQPKHVEIRTTSLPSDKIPPGRELRIAHLSDLHLHEFNSYYEKVASDTLRQKPDLILLTGDYVEQARNLSGVLAFLERLDAPAGVFAVQGNWEYWALIEGERLQRKFATAGVKLLIDQRADVIVRGLPVSLLGIDFPASSGSLQRLAGMCDPGRINIALSHVPAFQHALIEDRADLVLAGHTHGGQVRIPPIRPFHLPRYSGAFVDGLYLVGDRKLPLYVSRGIGTSVLPIRLFCRPEIGLIRLYGV